MVSGRAHQENRRHNHRCHRHGEYDDDGNINLHCARKAGVILDALAEEHPSDLSKKPHGLTLVRIADFGNSPENSLGSHPPTTSHNAGYVKL